jgi:23S rRNA (uracil1939-C5)-methyltransferase
MMAATRSLFLSILILQCLKSCLSFLPKNAVTWKNRRGYWAKRRGGNDESAAVIPQRNSWKKLVKNLEKEKGDAKFAKSKLAGVNKSKPDKDELQCIHFGQCSGCSTNSAFTDTPIMRQAKNYFANQEIPFEIRHGDIWHWRTHIKLAVQPMSKWGGLKFGLYQSQSHIVEAIPECRVHHPILNRVAEEIRGSAIDANVKGYVTSTAQHSHSGELRYIQLSLERQTGKVAIVLVWNAESANTASLALPRMLRRLRERSNNNNNNNLPSTGNADDWLHSVTVNFNTLTTNQIFDYRESQWRILYGPAVLRERVGNATFFFRPQIFRQANLNYFEEAILPLVQQHIPTNSSVAELYSGIGMIGLNVAHIARRVLCSDSNPFVNEVFDRCADSLEPQAIADRVYFEALDAESAVEAGQCDDVEIVIVDPPRRGLNELVLSFFLNQHPSKPLPNQLQRIIYVGCGFDAVETNSRQLVASGLWRITAAKGFALFPGTDHIETVVVFDRIHNSHHTQSSRNKQHSSSNSNLNTEIDD